MKDDGVPGSAVRGVCWAPLHVSAGLLRHVLQRLRGQMWTVVSTDTSAIPSDTGGCITGSAADPNQPPGELVVLPGRGRATQEPWGLTALWLQGGPPGRLPSCLPSSILRGPPGREERLLPEG